MSRGPFNISFNDMQLEHSKIESIYVGIADESITFYTTVNKANECARLRSSRVLPHWKGNV